MFIIARVKHVPAGRPRREGLGYPYQVLVLKISKTKDRYIPGIVKQDRVYPRARVEYQR
jgi:hypothetical protein